MADKIRIRRGVLANIPILDEGEFGLVTDRGTVYVGTDSDGNVLLNPVQVAVDGYTLDGYLYPAVDNVHGLGTADKRWHGVSVGPGSIHIIVKDTDPGFTQGAEFKIGIDESSGKLQFVGDGNVLMQMDAEAGVSIEGLASEQTVDEHYRQHSNAIQHIVQTLDGYQTQISALSPDITFQEFKTQQSQINQSVIQSLDGYAALALVNALDTTELQHTQQQNQINQSITQALDGYATLISGLDTTELQHTQQQNQINQSITQALDGYAILIGALDTTELQHTQQQNQINQSITQALDGYAVLISGLDTTELQHKQYQDQVNQLVVQALDGYAVLISGLDTTELQHRQQQNQINQSVLQALDGYAVVPDTTAISDGYLAFFIDGGKQIAGDNDLWWDREKEGLRLGSSDLIVGGTVESRMKILRSNGRPGLLIEGDTGVQSDLIFKTPAATANRRITQLLGQVDGSFVIRGVDDTFSAINFNLLVADLATGNIGIGTSVLPTQQLEIKQPAAASAYPINVIHNDSSIQTALFQDEGRSAFGTRTNNEFGLMARDVVGITLKNYTAGQPPFVGINTRFPIEALTVNGTLALQELASTEAPATQDGYGKLYVRDNKTLHYKNGPGVDQIVLTSALPFDSAGADGYIAFYADSVTHTGDNDLFWDRPNQRLLINTPTAIATGHRFQISNEDTGFGIQVIEHAAATYAFSGLEFRRSRGELGARTNVATGDTVGSMRFRGYNGSGFNDAVLIEAVIDTAVTGGGTNDMPGRLAFHTTPDGSGTLVERMRIGNGGRATIGGDGTLHSEAIKLHIANSGTGSIGNAAIEQVSTGDNDHLHLRKARGNFATRTIVASGDLLGGIVGLGYDGANYQIASRIDTFVDGTPGTSDMPGRLVFSTTKDGFSTTSERMRITNVGRVGINNTNPQAQLHVSGDGYFDGYLMPFTDDTWGLGTPDKRWRDLYLGPGSLHIIASAGQVGTAKDWTVGTTGAGDFSIGQGVSALTLSTDGKMTINANGTTIPAAYGYYWVREDGMDYVLERNDTSATGLQLRLQKARGAFGAPVAVVDGDAMGQLQFHGWDGATFLEGARISARVDGTPGTNDLPTSLVFYTTSDGAATPTEAARIKPDNSFHMAELAAAPTVTSGFGSVYPKTDGFLYFKNDTAVETNVSKAITYIAAYQAHTQAVNITRYYPIGGITITGATTTPETEVRMRGNGTIVFGRIYVGTNANTGTSTVTLMKNGSTTAITFSIPTTATGVFTVTATVTYVDGDLLCWQLVTGATGGALAMRVWQFDVL